MFGFENGHKKKFKYFGEGNYDTLLENLVQSSACLKNHDFFGKNVIFSNQ